MSNAYVKSFKITKYEEYGNTEKYSFKFRGDDIDEWAKMFFYIYAKIKWPTLDAELSNKENLTDEKVKENKKRFINLVDGFVSSIKTSSNNYYIDDIKANTLSSFSGNYNRDKFYVYETDIVSIKTPSLKDIDFKLKYNFEKNLSNTNFYLGFLWAAYNKSSAYLKDKKFIQEIEKLAEKATHKLLYMRDKNIKREWIINPLLEQINLLHDDKIKEELLKLTANANLTFYEYDKINELVRTIRYVNKFEKKPDEYKPNIWGYFKMYLDDNYYMEKIYTNSLSKAELVDILNYTENHEIFKLDNLRVKTVYRLFKYYSPGIIKSFMENNIFTKI